MKIINIFIEHQNNQSIRPKPCRVLNIQTDYESIEVVNLKSVWINEYLGTYRLMYSDDIYEYNCIYWTAKPNNNFHKYKNKIIAAYNNGDSFVEV